MIKLIIFLAVIGMLDSLYTALQQKTGKLPEVCFTRGINRTSCNEVLHSKYARVFNIPNSWLGILGYALIAIIYYYAGFFSSVGVGADRLFFIGASISTMALILSYYLLYVQASIIKKFCIFCLTSTFIITVITILAWSLVI